MSFAARIRSSPRARRRWRSSRSASWRAAAGRVLVAKAVKRGPSRSVSRSCAPGCGRSLRTMTRIPFGQLVQVEQAGDLGDPGAVAGLAVGVVGRGPRRWRDQRGELVDDGLGQAEPDRVRQTAATVQPVEELVGAAGRRRCGSAPSARAGARPGVRAAGASACRMTVMWSAAVFDPAFPGRSSTASGSPVPAGPWSTNAHNGWNPKPRLERRRRVLLLRVRGHQGGVQVDDQRPVRVDAVVRRVLPASAHTRARARRGRCRSPSTPRSASAASASIVRDTVGSEATGPNTPGSARSTAISARQSPPSASAPRDRARPSPGRAPPAACATAPAPPTTHGPAQPGPDRLGQHHPPGLRHHRDPAVSTSEHGYNPVVFFT